MLISHAKDGKKDPRGKWLEFRDKESKSGQPFYYNTGYNKLVIVLSWARVDEMVIAFFPLELVTRKCTRELPRDFKPDNTRLVPEAIFGLNFYH